MDYKEFLVAFYRKNQAGGLLGYRSKKKLTEFFFSNALTGEERENLLPTSDDAYDRWFDGSRSPKTDVWAAIASRADTDNLEKAILKALNDSRLRELFATFEIEILSTEVPDKRRFANAVKEQFIAIAKGNGEADNIIPEEYKKSPEPVGFKTYLRGAVDKFESMRFPNEEEYLLKEYFVCNNIGTMSVVYPRRSVGKYIEDATLEKIRTYDKRGEIWCALIIGACGYGKTIMLQHLFLDAAENHAQTGCIPVFAELRHFSSRFKEFLAFLVETVQEYDVNFTQEEVIGLLEKGKLQILLDGLDEMDPEETNYFQKKFAEFRQHYPNNQIIISSRQCAAISGISGCVKLYLHPMDEKQSEALIDKLLQDNEDEGARDIIASFMDPDTGYVSKNGFIATNPMLLTIMVRNYRSLHSLGGNKLKFYEIMYDMLIRVHDEEKSSFGRFFHSVSDGDEFTQVFREFCAKSYLDRCYKFDHRSFEWYFKKIKGKEELSNPGKFKLRAFQQDVCATACMMYEQDTGFYYIDPGFQDYFFAEYYYFADTESTKQMGRALWRLEPDMNRNLDAFKMFNSMSYEKFDVCLVLPYLDSIFRGKNEIDAFINFLTLGFGKLTYTVTDDSLIEKGMELSQTDKHDIFLQPMNQPKTMIVLLSEILNIPIRNTELVIHSRNIKKEKNATHFLLGYPGRLSDYSVPIEKRPRAFLNEMHEIEAQTDPNFIGMFEEPMYVDDNGLPVSFGYSYLIDSETLKTDPETLNLIIEESKSTDIFDAYTRLRKYYSELIASQGVNEYQ